MLKKINNILIIRLSSMGDVILTTSLIRQIKSKYPDVNLHFVTAKPFTDIYRYNPRISKLIEYDKSGDLRDIVRLKNELRQIIPGGKYDLVIDLQRNLRSKIFRSGLGRNYLFIHKRRLHKLSLVYLKRPLMKEIVPLPEIYRFAASSLKIEDDHKGLEIWLPEEKNNSSYIPDETEYSEKTEPIRIAIAPGAYHETKRWPIEKYIDLLNKLKAKYNADMVLIGGTNDKALTDIINGEVNFSIDDKSGSTSILETAKIISQCSLLITNDTGVMHIAAARKIPVAAIFGSTVKEFGFIPFRTRNQIIEKDISCRPCTHIGLNKCPKGHFDCMNKISVREVLNVVSKILNN
ncbi:glycosyltransferase family 9 protein [Bacteroidota bacterium]